MFGVQVRVCFFKQKTAYEMRISDWSSDVCSSDLVQGNAGQRQAVAFETAHQFGDEVLRVGGGAAVSAGKDFSVVGQRAEQKVDSGRKRFGQFFGSRKSVV